MAIKITCSKCSKRISIDEAFAGGVCRCPYCTTINDVPLHPGQEPTPAASKTPKRVPVAKKASLQGIVALLIMLVFLGIIIGVIVTVVVVTGNGGADTSETPAVVDGPQNPFLPCPAGFVAGTLRVDSPVVYCLDGDTSMGSYFPYAARMTGVSLRALTDAYSAQVLLVGRLPTESIVITGGAGDSALNQALAGFTPGDGEDIDGVVERAISSGPATVVIITRRMVDLSLADRAIEAGVTLVTVGISPSTRVADRLRDLAQRTGGESRIFSLETLRGYDRQAN